SKTLSGYATFVAKVREYEKKCTEQDVPMPTRGRRPQKAKRLFGILPAFCISSSVSVTSIGPFRESGKIGG
ncbi:MAG: hypothetical protein FWG13_05410, partial [Leptospirales bacterium]|nr:hypothetical protein [Leptospirales bacterium]